MKIRIKKLDQFAGVGLSTGRLGEPGAKVEVPDEEGALLCSEGLAEPIAEDPEKGVEKRAEGEKSDEQQTAKRGPGRPRKTPQG